MPLYVVERRFREALELTGDDLGAIREENRRQGIEWLRSYLSADRTRSYCVYTAPGPESIRAAASALSLPADAVTEVSEIAPPA